MYYLIWSYTVDPARQEKFEEEYSRNGSWFRFYEPCVDYLGHELIKNTQASSYLLIDKWMSKEAYEGFVKSNLLEYDALNRSSAELYETEELIGSYNPI